jgi:hypothetical protein
MTTQPNTREIHMENNKNMSLIAAIGVGIEALGIAAAHELAVGDGHAAARRYDAAADGLRRLLERTNAKLEASS